MAVPHDHRTKVPHHRDEPIPTDCFQPRSYQTELLDHVVKKNSIICMGTGTGKTFVGVMLIKQLASQIRKPFLDGGRRTFFLVNQTALAMQQGKVIEQHTDLSVGTYIGADGVDVWTKEAWTKVFVEKQVLVMTAQILLDVLEHGMLSFDQINLLIFDECHHASGNHPYAQIMNYGKRHCEREQFPHILGLTASILNRAASSASILEQSIIELETILCATAVTSSDSVAMDQFGTKPLEEFLKCEDYVDTTGLIAKMDLILNSAIKFLSMTSEAYKQREKEIGDTPESALIRNTDVSALHPCGLDLCERALNDCQTILHELGPWAAACVASNFIRQLVKGEKNPMPPVEVNKRFFQLGLTVLRQLHYEHEKYYDREVLDIDDMYKLVSPKVKRFVRDVLYAYKPDDDFEITVRNDSGEEALDPMDYDSDGSDLSDEVAPLPGGQQPGQPRVVAKRPESFPSTQQDLTGIVFVERRNSAFVLNKLMEQLCIWDENLYFIKSAYMVGSGSKGQTKESKLCSKNQEETLKKFRSKDVNLLVSTSVLREGIDIPKCNLVTLFDVPKTYPEYVQAKGRARAVGSKFFMLASNEELGKCVENVEDYQKYESVIAMKCLSREDPSTEVFDLDPDQYLAPYLPEVKEGMPQPQVTMTSSVCLVNRYCMMLPSDVFTRLAPDASYEEFGDENSKQFVCTLKLPINSPLKVPIVSPPMPRKKLSQMAAALKACERLHKIGELNENLLPVGKEAMLQDEEEIEVDPSLKAGTPKRKQYYKKRIAQCFTESSAEPREKCQLYFIKMVLTFPLPDEQNTHGRRLYPPEATPRGFGFLLRKSLPVIPDFPVFTRSGEVTITLEKVSDSLELEKEKLDDLFIFHRYLFQMVLRLEKDPMVHDPENADLGLTIVPLLRQESDELEIDWEFVNLIVKNKDIPYLRHEGEFIFNLEQFKDAVVTPSYRNFDKPQYFYVAEIRSDLTPVSQFPSPDNYSTFEEYFQMKYSQKISNKTQPLLDVDHTSVRLNLLTPRYLNQKGIALPTSNAQTKRAKRESLQNKQIFVPELCGIHLFPGTLWRKGVCLPTIMYRLNQLLIANEIRSLIIKQAGIGIENLPEGEAYPRLDFGFKLQDQLRSTAKKAALAQKQLEEQNRLLEEEEAERLKTVEKFEGTIDEWKCPDVEGPVAKSDMTEQEEEILKEWRKDRRDVQTASEGWQAAHLEEVAKAETKQAEFEEHRQERIVQFKTQEALQHTKMEIVEGLGVEKEEEKEEGEIVDDDGFKVQKWTPTGPTAEQLEMERLLEERRKDLLEVEKLDLFSDFEDRYDAKYGPSPCVILQTLTMSNANDFFNLERLETIGDSFLKFAVTVHLFNNYAGIHEGKLSYKRSRQVSNYNLFNLGRKKGLAECMISTKFEPNENWLPPGYTVKELPPIPNPNKGKGEEDFVIPYCLQTQHSLPDKSIADCVEALIGCYLITCGKQPALDFMSWLGLQVQSKGPAAKELEPVFKHVQSWEVVLSDLTSGMERFEEQIQYKFNDKGYLLQALTHASYHYNRITDCYQRLEFLGDAILDYVITRFLFEDSKRHSPGVLTDLRSALVNNNIFAKLAVKWNFHQPFKYMSPDLYHLIDKFVSFQKDREDRIELDENYDDEGDAEGEDIEIPKALGDIFESIAGAIYLDSGRSLETVWRVYYRMMKPQIEKFTISIPKSPVRELLELEPEAAKFEKPDRTSEGKVRVMVSIAGKGSFMGVGRNYRIAKSAAAKRALKVLKPPKITGM